MVLLFLTACPSRFPKDTLTYILIDNLWRLDQTVDFLSKIRNIQQQLQKLVVKETININSASAGLDLVSTYVAVEMCYQVAMPVTSIS